MTHTLRFARASRPAALVVLMLFVLGGALAPAIRAGDLPLPLIVQEARPAGWSGVDRDEAIATFGLPFGKGEVGQVQGRPALRVAGTPVYQFTTLDTWSDGSVRWALCDLRADVETGTQHGGFSVVAGQGLSSQSILTYEGPASLQADTGEVDVFISKAIGSTPAPLMYVRHRQTPASYASSPMWLVGQDLDGTLLLPGPGTAVSVVQNGPARSLIRVDGPMVRLDDGARAIDVTALITLRRGSGDVQVSVTVRNADADHPAHVRLEALSLVLQGQLGPETEATVAHPSGPQAVDLGPDESGSVYQAYSSAHAVHIDSPDYLPHIPKVEGSQVDLMQEGYAVVLNGDVLAPLGDKDSHPRHGWLDLTGRHGGVTASIQYMPHMWPAALEASGKGVVVAGLFPHQNVAPYTWIFKQHESRTAVFSFHGGHLTGPTSHDEMEAVARRLDMPAVGRAADYKHYDRAGVFPYRLLTKAEHEQVYSWMGLPHELDVSNGTFGVMRYIGKSFTGGSNNYALIEDRLASAWLRTGMGGQYLKGLDYALWKCEWQIARSDDSVYDRNLSAVNEETVPTTDRNFGDEEHRYREGIVAAYYLTGDPRYRDALFDEAEVLKSVELYQQERSMYQTLRALAVVGEFTHDPELFELLEERVAWFCTPSIDISNEDGGWGWEGPSDGGERRYFANSADYDAEKPPGENFQCRGWITASLGPLGLWHAAQALGPATPHGELARGRMRDLSFWTREELFPFVEDPFERHLPYSYAVSLMEFTETESFDFHPILLGMAESYLDTGDLDYLKRGVEQIQAFSTHDNGPHENNLYLVDSRLDAQHFFAVLGEWYLSQF